MVGKPGYGALQQYSFKPVNLLFLLLVFIVVHQLAYST